MQTKDLLRSENVVKHVYVKRNDWAGQSNGGSNCGRIQKKKLNEISVSIILKA